MPIHWTGVLPRSDERSSKVGNRVAGLSVPPVLAHYQSNDRHPTPGDLGAAVTRLRKQFLEDFDAAYVRNVIVPHFLVSAYHGERPSLPMIDVTLTKENALPYD